MKIIKLTLLSILLLAATIKVKAQTAAANITLNNIITAYLDIKSALAADNSTAAQDKAKVLNTQINAVLVNDLTAAQQSVWKNYADKLSFDSRHMSETKAIDHQREHFASLSKNLYTVIKDLKINSSVLYWQYCPMKKMSWLSATSTIENPYYGKAMPDCGSTKETLKAAK
ncbi:DUF3347 domain-containing protein [Mucilaginibacter sp.]|uniref:DUF3347 domain-containing protein n=1 Tax=Mucilaginibacter sp. TaxID=1882438 RepID=UPI00261B907B|nr:DUF3347 domain-containing protein [Mucilaginibacter sp.]MDB4927383.1 hypothetical protein [Mucilaginibacter sp.]